MARPRWRKLWRDLWMERGRAALMVVAVAVSLLGVGAVLGAYAILTREISRNYLGTRPASATLELEAVDRALVDEVRQRPGVAEAEARGMLLARVKVGRDWRPLLLFVIDDFGSMRLNRFRHEGGAWPPPEGSMLIERTAERMLEAGPGQSVRVKTPHGQAREVAIRGVVHDPSLAPAWQERAGYGYITRETLAWLGEAPVLDELRVEFAATGEPLDAPATDAAARELAAWLQQRGQHVHHIEVPPPRRHPHQTQMTAILFMMLAFSGLALVLSAILVATTLAGLLARQVREIGVMKAVGAGTGQIGGLYAVMTLLLGSGSAVLAVPPSLFVARALSRVVAEMLNFELASEAIPGWVLAVQVAAGVLVPLAVAAVPIFRSSRVSVRQAIDDHGITQEAPGAREPSRVLGALGGLDRMLLLALRNASRRRGRLVLTVGLLAAGGGMFMMALNVMEGWERYVGEVPRTRHYDVEVRFGEPQPTVRVESLLRGVPGVRTVEAWGYLSTAFSKPGLVDVSRVYPDGGHGSFSLRAPPVDTALVRFPLMSGRWLVPGDTDAVVLNHLALVQAPHVRVGDRVSLSVDGRPTDWHVVGIVEEVGSPAAAYVTDEALARVAGAPGHTQTVRIVTTASDPEARVEVIRAVEHALEQAGVGVELAIPLVELRTAMGDHVVILVRMLIAMALLMATVGAIGLTSAMGMSVLERTRELGVMQAIGATPGAVLRLIVTEGVFVGALSWVAALLLSVPLTALVGNIVGRLAFWLPLPLVLSPEAMLLWLALVLVGAMGATALPAWRASRLTVREALAHV
jgi:putative ABC transport system permease protein